MEKRRLNDIVSGKIYQIKNWIQTIINGGVINSFNNWLNLEKGII